MNWVGRIVKSGPWAGWRVTSNRAIFLQHTVTHEGRVVTTDYTGKYKCICTLEDSHNPMCTASGIIFHDDQLEPVRVRQQLL